MPNNYSRGKIYKIVCRKTGLQYIGSTTEPTLARRMAGHVRNFKRWKKGKFAFTSSFSVMEENDYYIELVELVPCSSNDELKVRERFHIQNNDCVNKIVPLRTNKEYYEDNKEQILEKAKEYFQVNKEQILEKHKEYHYTHKEHLLEKMKEYRNEHKEEIAENKKEWYKANKEQLAEKAKEKYDCLCGSTLCKGAKARHEKSIKHQTYLKNQLENAEKSLEKNDAIEYADCV